MVERFNSSEKKLMLFYIIQTQDFGVGYYQMEHEIRQHIPIFYYNIWDDLPAIQSIMSTIFMSLVI